MANLTKTTNLTKQQIRNLAARTNIILSNTREIAYCGEGVWSITLFDHQTVIYMDYISDDEAFEYIKVCCPALLK